jgi:hypothetical protein
MLDNKYIAHVLFLKHVDRKNYKIDKQCEVLSHREWHMTVSHKLLKLQFRLFDDV